MLRRIGVLLMLPVVLGTTGCATGFGLGLGSGSNSGYGTGDSRMVQTVEYGTVVGSKVVDLRGEATELGRSAGSSIGWGIGFDKGRHFDDKFSYAAILGGVGAIVGEIVEAKVRSEWGHELTVRLEGSGSEIVVVQPIDASFADGERVRILFDRDGRARIQKADAHG